MDEFMSQKKVKRSQVMGLLKEEKISQQEASRRIGASVRQVMRLMKGSRTEGLLKHFAPMQLSL